MAQDNRAVVAIESTPLEYWIATTDPRDLAEMERVKAGNPGLSALQLLKALAEKHPTGLAAGGAK